MHGCILLVTLIVPLAAHEGLAPPVDQAPLPALPLPHDAFAHYDEIGFGDCIDHPSWASQCPAWAEIGECLSNPTWMLVYCALSCNQCDYPLPGPVPLPAVAPVPELPLVAPEPQPHVHLEPPPHVHEQPPPPPPVHHHHHAPPVINLIQRAPPQPIHIPVRIPIRIPVRVPVRVPVPVPVRPRILRPVSAKFRRHPVVLGPNGFPKRHPVAVAAAFPVRPAPVPFGVLPQAHFGWKKQTNKKKSQ